MLMLTDGPPTGSIGGGVLEGTCQAAARALFQNTVSFSELNFELNASSAAEKGMLCGGSVSVLLHRVEPALLELFRQLHSEYVQGLKPLLLTILPHDGEPPRMVHLGQQHNSDLPVDLRAEILRKGRRAPFLISYKDQEVFVEPLVHPGLVHLVGAGHVALATAQLAAFVGFEVVVMDDRAEFASMARFPQAREVRVLDTFGCCLEKLGPDDYVIIITRGHVHDQKVLAQALRTAAGYVGMIGSHRKRDAIFNSLRNEGFTNTDLDRIHCPIGLSIGADTPEEIAMSIVAELVQIRAGMNG
jgi:xanthine dehydrogenase accessory factor